MLVSSNSTQIPLKMIMCDTHDYFPSILDVKVNKRVKVEFVNNVCACVGGGGGGGSTTFLKLRG